MPAGQGEFKFAVTADEGGHRLDAVVAGRMEHTSRSQAAAWIRQGIVLCDDTPRKPGYKVRTDEVVSGFIPEAVVTDLISEEISFSILYEDDGLIVVNKPPGLVVHPAAGHPTGTLVNGLLHHCPDLEGIGGEKRPGIVHRLDKDTSGVMVVAKNGKCHEHLSRQFKARSLEKSYLAVVAGVPEHESGMIDFPIGRHPTERKKMSVSAPRSREACTLWRVTERYRLATLLEVDLKTGRTHQIRVHCRAMGHPIIGDPVYGPSRHFGHQVKGDPPLMAAIRPARRQMLHALRLTVEHPETHRRMTFEAPLPEDMQSVINALRRLDE